VSDSPGSETVRIPTAQGDLIGDLELPARPLGLVLFAHGSGSGRLSPRNQWVASALRDAGLATLLFDLLTPEEGQIDLRAGELRFDIPLLGARLTDATSFVQARPRTSELPLGYFGASTGAAAALSAASHCAVAAIVSRGGRPDLAPQALGSVLAATLLIVGGADDPVVLEVNRWALDRLARAEKRLEIVPGAGHLFEEPGALGRVAELARAWFVEHFAAAGLRCTGRCRTLNSLSLVPWVLATWRYAVGKTSVGRCACSMQAASIARRRLPIAALRWSSTGRRSAAETVS